MSKRGAVVQIDKDGKYLNEVSASHLDDNDDQLSGPQLASAEVMATRKILKPRSKKMKSMGFGSMNSNSAFSKNEPVSGFTAVSNSIAKADSDEKHLKIQALNEQFFQKIKDSMNESQPKVVDFSNLCEKYIEYIKSINGLKSTADGINGSKLPLPSNETNKNEENTNGSQSKPFASITPFGTEPLQKESDTNHSKPFGFTFGAKPATQTTKTESKSTEQISSNESDVTKGETQKPNPFSFLGATPDNKSKDVETKTSSKPVFSFKPANNVSESTITSKVNQPSKPSIPLVKAQADPSEDESDDDEEEKKPVKVEGPAFTISNPPITSDSVFSFKAKKPKVKSDSDSESEVEIKGPTFNFAGSVKSNVFNLPQNKEDAGEKTKKKDTSALPTTNDKSTVPEEPAEKAKPAFAFTGFGTSATPTAPEPVVKPAQPAFNFPSADTTALKDSKEKSTTGVEETKENEKPKFAFSFGNKQPEETREAKPLSSSKDAEETKPKPAFSFSFGASSSSPTETSGNKIDTPISFGGAAPSPKPAFSFGTSSAPSNDESAKPAPFKFGSTSSFTSSAPSFSFGQAKTTGDSSDNNKTEKNDQNQIKPSQGFSFSLPFQQSKTTFGSKQDDSKTSSSTFGSTTPASKPAAESSASEATAPAAPEAETNEPSDEVHTGTNNKVVVAPSTEEETEDVLYKNRAKLMLYVPASTDDNGPTAPSYSSQGIGEIKLLKDKSDPTKVRFLLRSDGMGNILLNTYVLKKFTYGPLSQDQENLVKIPVVDPSSNSLKTYVLKVKQKADGRRLINTIKDAQEKL
ncbi:hypothetical protein ACO0QE_003096 [Hanseniaspora vineae]